MSTKPNSSQVKYDGGTVQDVLDSAKPMANYTALRTYTGRATSVRITTPGIAGFFQRDSDVVTADNGGTVIVDASERRWKRVFDGAVNAFWWGIETGGVIDNRAPAQSAINYAVENQKRIKFPSGKIGLSGGLLVAGACAIEGEYTKGTVFVALAPFAENEACIKVQGASRVPFVELRNFEITGDPRRNGLSTEDLQWIPRGIEVDLTSLALIEDVEIDHTSQNGYRSGNATASSHPGPDQLTLRRVKISVCGGDGLHHAFGHSFHMFGGLIEFCEGYGASLSNVNSIFFNDVDIESNQLAGVRVSNNRNVVFDKCTFEANARSLADDSNEKVHLLMGTFNRVQVETRSCYFHAKNMRNMVRIDRGTYKDDGSLIDFAYDAASWTGSGNRGAVMVFTKNAEAEVGDFGVQAWPAGQDGTINLLPLGRGRNRIQNRYVGYGDSLPDFGLWSRGSEWNKVTPAVGSSPGWVCIQTGMFADINAGATTASGVSGAFTLTLSSAVDLFVGAIISVVGHTPKLRIKQMSGLTATIERVDSPSAGLQSTFTNASVSEAQPVFAQKAVLS